MASFLGGEPNTCGVLAIEVYFPSSYVPQTDLEKANGVSEGKYTIGLGQDAMAFTGDREDVNSISLTVVQSLMEKYHIDKHTVGRLEVGTESLVDKSKSTKTVLMSLFEGNTDIEGATVINACYGGTAALLNALAWVDSSSWDGRYAIVVAADIAVYADGPARPTGGCGAVAMLIGRNAPLIIDLRSRATHACHVWDFFKPKMESEYPEVNGALSQTCYLRALDDCYTRFLQKKKALYSVESSVATTDYFLFHSPYNKLVQKSFARLCFLDIVASRNSMQSQQETYAKWVAMPIERTYEDKDLETKLKDLAAPLYKQKVAPSCELSKNIGNTYTASVYMNLANIVASQGASLDGKVMTLFSYGSGALATMLEIKGATPTLNGQSSSSSNNGHGSPPLFTLQKIQDALNLSNRLASREKLSPNDLSLALEGREKSHGHVPFKPIFMVDKLFPGTYYLDEITTSYERIYRRKGLDAPRMTGGPMKEEPPDFAESYTSGDTDDEAMVTAMKSGMTLEHPMTTYIAPLASEKDRDISPRTTTARGMRRNETQVWASGRPIVRVVVTGVAAALPGRTKDVFAKGVNNIQRIIDGEQCIGPIPDIVKDQMLQRNVILLKKNADGTQTTTPVTTHGNNVNLCATIGNFNLTSYGVPESIASTMDRAVQVAVAAGLEALKDARIVTGEGSNMSGWVLPEHLQETTGVVYATSFPALDAAIEEVSKFFETKSVKGDTVPNVIAALRTRLELATGPLSAAAEEALASISTLFLNACAANATDQTQSSTNPKPYEFDRKFLFRVLVLGNAQLAQIIKARGPNMQTNAACAGATQAIALAYDMIQVGRAERMVVIAGDNASSDNLMPWLGNGFRALGAATICSDLGLAAIPFDRRRSGMILGSGGIGMVLESEEGALRRYKNASASGLFTPESLRAWQRPFRCRLLGTLFSNSAYHGASMDKVHIAAEMERFVASLEKEQGILRADLARHGVYFSHETATHSSPSASCAANEIYGLRKVFGEDLKHLLILNTKGFTGHPMGVSFEDVVACEVLVTGRVPPIANYVESETDPYLGPDIKLSRGGAYPCKYAMRFAAGFGSQIALALYGVPDTGLLVPFIGSM